MLGIWLSSWLPVAVWAWLIFFLSSIPHLNSGLGVWDFVLRKIAHVTEFGVLTALLVRAFQRTWPEARTKSLLWSSGVCAVFYAMSDEFHQSFVPGRGPSVR